MTNFTEQSVFTEGVRMIEPGDSVIGGVNAPINLPFQALANRTLYLKTELAKAVQSIGGLQAITIGAGAGLTGGGSLAANRSLALATPSTLSGSTANWAGSGGTGHTHELAKATATLAGVVRLIDNLTAGGRDAALSAEQGKELKKAIDEAAAACLPLTGGALSDTLELKGYNALSWRNASSPRPYAVHLIRGNDPYIGLVTDAANIDKKWGSGNDGSVAGNYTYFFPKASGTLLVTGSVENSLTSNAAAVPLSAAMGKKLADEKADKSWVTQQAQAVRTALKNEILGGAGAAFDTLKEFQTALGGDADFAATTAGHLAEAAPSGMIAYFAGQTAPAGWLKANGAAVSRTAYAKLFAAIGTTYGAGDGKTTFNLPDLRGEFLRGWDDARGIDTGRVFGSAQAHAMQTHTHGIGIMSNSDDVWFIEQDWSGTYPAALLNGELNRYERGTATGGAYDHHNLGTTPATTAGEETRPRNIALLACIKI